MKNVIAILAFLMLGQSQAAFAQNGGQVQGQAKRTVLYDERTNELVDVQPQVAETGSANNQQGAPIYILNNQKFSGSQGGQQQAQRQYVDQPTTVIQDSPLKVSAADSMRRKRQDVEASTEDGIVQALEQARLQDEVRRRERFSGALQNEVQQPVIVQQQPPVIVAPPPVVAPQNRVEVVEVRKEVEVRKTKDDRDDRDDRSEIRGSFREPREGDLRPRNEYYVSGLVGVGKYPDVVNVRGNMSGGVSVGTVTQDHFVVEGTFLYGNYELNDLYSNNISYYGNGTNVIDVKQYNLSAAVKYQFLTGKLRPNVGALVSYTRRSYSQNNFDYGNTDAVDVGALVGLDLALTEQFSIGVDFRYLTNVGTRDNSNYRNSFTYSNPIEKLDYYIGSLSGKITF